MMSELLHDIPEVFTSIIETALLVMSYTLIWFFSALSYLKLNNVTLYLLVASTLITMIFSIHWMNDMSAMVKRQNARRKSRRY